MPIEFSVAAYRLGHSMVRDEYEWNRIFRTGGLTVATLELLFRCTGTSGSLSPGGDINDPESGSFERLPTNWVAGFRRLFDLPEGGRPDLAGEHDHLQAQLVQCFDRSGRGLFDGVGYG
jgi:hypothetical protein